MDPLSDLEIDLLGEAFNVGVAYAAGALSELVQQEVALTVPEVALCEVNDLVAVGNETTVFCGVSQKMTGTFDSYALLLLEENSSYDVIRAVLGKTYPYEMLAELYQDSLTEIGNIVLNACIHSISEFLQLEFEVGLPQFRLSSSDDFFPPSVSGDNTAVLRINIGINLVESDVSGAVGFLLGQNAMVSIRQYLAQYIEGLM